MLSVGLLERAYTDTRDRVILSFFGIASVGFILIIAITYYEVRRITQPLGVMAAATRSIAAGKFDDEVSADCQGEIALLAESFNRMLQSLRQMKGDLEEWGRTLEHKVKERSDQLAAMQARVAQSERLASVGMLAAGVAHEVNNPLGSILSLTALTLEDLPPGDPNREGLEVVLRQAERCRDIVRKLLEFSRRAEPKAELLDLNEVLEETHSLIARQAAFHNIEVVKAWAPDLPRVLGDKSQLTQVFMNMMINAVQSMGERGTLTLATRISGAGVEVEIRDTGCGIPRELVGQIFDPFFSTKSSGQGTGLGLSIAYGIVTAHQGTITVESEPGHGTAFRVRLPGAEVQVEARG
jgi:two-component system NtrC family sensor kinase